MQFHKNRSARSALRVAKPGRGFVAFGVALVTILAILVFSATRSEAAVIGGFRAGLMTSTDARTPFVYISDDAQNFIDVFDRAGQRLRTITNRLRSPEGLFVDGQHNLWVANRGASTVLKFARGASSPSETLADPKSEPYDVTICPNGTVYVANVGANFSGGDIAVYAGGSHRPTGTLTAQGAAFFFVTCDGAGNVFGSVLLGTCSLVAEFPGGQQAGSLFVPNVGSCGNPGGIKIDNAGNLLYNNEGGEVTEFTEGGAPTGRSINVPLGWTDIALDRAGTAVVGANISGGSSFRFPGGRSLNAYQDPRFVQPIGTAFDPGQRI